MSAGLDASGRIVAWDVDDVLLAWREGFHAWMGRNGLPGRLRPEESVLADFSDCWPELGGDGVQDQVRLFNRSEDFLSLRRLPGAAEAVAASRIAGGPGCRLIAVTAAGTHPATAAMRKAQIEGFGFDGFRILPLGASKAEALADLLAAVMIDDSPRVLAEAAGLGLKTVAKSQPYNLSAAADARVGCWISDVEALLEILRTGGA